MLTANMDEGKLTLFCTDLGLRFNVTHVCM